MKPHVIVYDKYTYQDRDNHITIHDENGVVIAAISYGAFFEIMKSFDCLSCENLDDWDFDYDENHWFVCKLDFPENEDLNGCPHFRSSSEMVNEDERT